MITLGEKRGDLMCDGPASALSGPGILPEMHRCTGH
jgi:hypothetical protein